MIVLTNSIPRLEKFSNKLIYKLLLVIYMTTQKEASDFLDSMDRQGAIIYAFTVQEKFGVSQEDAKIFFDVWSKKK